MAFLKQIVPRSEADQAASPDDATILYRPPASWPTDHRTRRYITLPERHYSHETDLEMLRRSVHFLVGRQDARGSYHTDEEYRQGDRVDDQLGAAAMVAFLLSLTGPDPRLIESLERGVRFHLDHLVCRSAAQPYPYSRYRLDRDTAFDVPNNVWILWGGSLVLKYGLPYLSKNTAEELRGLMGQTWLLISTNPVRGENPCHNQVLAFCEIAVLYARATNREEIERYALDYYHQCLRPLRVLDRGHRIYTEFNLWDANYGLLSWMSLEHLFAATGDPAFAEDADEMAAYFNELVSAGGYSWGGPRYNEGGLEEFIHLPASRAVEMGLDRLLIPAPADEWDRLILDGHYGRVLILRMSTPVRTPNVVRSLPPTAWSFRNGPASVCLDGDIRLHHLSSSGLEIIPPASPRGDGGGLTWLEGGVWKRDLLQLQPPPASAGLSYVGSRPIQLRGVLGVASFQRGYIWETRQWWLAAGRSLLWVGQFFCHAVPTCERIDFVLGNPVLTRLSGRPVPVTEVETAEGASADTQGDAASVLSRKFLRFGDVFVGATAPLEFVRPSPDAFHTFPLSKQIYLRDCESSNEIRLHVSETPAQIDCRQSFFFAIEIGRDRPALRAQGDAARWTVEAGPGRFEATLSGGFWRYHFKTAGGEEELPQIGFGFDPEIRSSRC